MVIRAGAAIDQLEFETNKGRLMKGGGGGGKRHELTDINISRFTVYHGDRVNGLTVQYVKPFYPSVRLTTGDAIVEYIPPNTKLEIFESSTIKALESLKSTITKQRVSGGKASIGVEIEKVFKLGFEASTNRTFTNVDEAFEQFESTIVNETRTSFGPDEMHNFFVVSVDVWCNPAEGGYLVPFGKPQRIRLSQEQLHMLAGYWTFLGGRAVELVSGLRSIESFGERLLVAGE